MQRFWTGIGIVLLIGLAATFSVSGNTNNKIMINDLETECREDRDTRTNIELREDNSFKFQGYFPVEETSSDINFNYKTGNNIILNIKTEDKDSAEFLWYDCLASGVYDLETQPFNEGMYSVEIKHNGERVEKRIIQIKD